MNKYIEKSTFQDERKNEAQQHVAKIAGLVASLNLVA